MGLFSYSRFFEVGWAMGLKYSQGFTKILPSILTVIGMVASLYFLSLSLKSLPLGNAYAIWTGIGTVGCGLRYYFIWRTD